jgi:hypothetical protein
MSKPKKLPIIKALVSDNIEDEVGVSAVALVDRPAIMADFMAFSADQGGDTWAPVWQTFKDKEDRHIVTGPLMIADLPIYRKMNGKEFYVVYESDTIYKMVQKFFKKGYQSQVNFMHDGIPVEGITLFESFIVDKSRGVQPLKGFEKIPAGSWFGSFIVENAEAWEKIKAGEFKGFSIEGLFTLVGLEEVLNTEQEPESPEDIILKRIKDILSQKANA